MASSPSVRGIPLLAIALLLAALAAPPRAAAQFPIPPAYPGIAFGPQPRERVVVLEAFFDLTCPSCRAGWPAVRQAVEFYGPRLRLVLHPFVLPFHHNSNFAARSINAIAAINVSLAYDWLDTVFKHQDEFSTEATWDKTPHDVVQHFAELATEVGVPAERFLDAFGSPATDVATRVSFKYGCLRAIIQTPSYFVNGVPVRDADDEWTLEDWQTLLNPIIFGYKTQNGAGGGIDLTGRPGTLGGISRISKQ